MKKLTPKRLLIAAAFVALAVFLYRTFTTTPKDEIDLLVDEANANLDKITPGL